MGYYSYIILLLRSRAFNAKNRGDSGTQGFHFHGMEVEDEKREI